VARDVAVAGRERLERRAQGFVGPGLGRHGA
jgi:hypothetical protein